MISNNFITAPMSNIDIINFANNIRGICKDYNPNFDIVKHLIDQPIEELGVDVVIEPDTKFSPDIEAYTEPFAPIIHFRQSHFDALTGTLNTNSWLYGRAKFTLAHELMHALKHTFKNTDELIFCRKAMETNPPRYRHTEWQANKFAGALLIPSALFMNRFRFMAINNIAQECGVSYSATEAQINLYNKLLKENPSNASTLLGF